MRRIRYLAYVLFSSLTLLAVFKPLTRAQQTPPVTQPAKPAQTPPAPPPPKPDEQATKLLSQLADLLEPRKLGWIETAIYQKFDTQGLSFQGEGRYLSGPSYRMRLDMKVTLGKTAGESVVVSDGSTVWNSTHVAGSEPSVSKWSLKKVNEVLSSPGTMPQLRDNFYRSQSFLGLAPLFQTLKQQMVFTKHETDQWKGKDVFKLTGVWSADIARGIAPPQGPWPYFVPRTCRIYVDKQSSWPMRFEWWGPTAPDKEDSLLVLMELRSPKRHGTETNPPASLAKAFEFDPGKAKVVDLTQQMTEQLAKARSMQPSLPPRSSSSVPSTSTTPTKK